MADFNKPVIGDTYANVLAYERALAADCVTLADSRRTAPTNLPDYAKRWNDTAKVFENWLSSTWSTLVLSVSGGGTGAINAAGARANIDAAYVGDMNAHIGNVTTAHGCTSNAAPLAIMSRDGAGRAKVTAPSAADDIARLQEISDHAALTAAHGATSAATASRIPIRDAAGRTQFAAPAASADAAIKQTVDDHAALTSPHGATVGASGNRIPVRDASGRAQFANPAVAADAATKAYVDANAQQAGSVVQVSKSIATDRWKIATSNGYMNDDTLPLYSEGEYAMSGAITPKSASNLLVVRATIHVGAGNVYAMAALFNNSQVCVAVSGPLWCQDHTMACLTIDYAMTAGTTSPLTFYVRISNSTGGPLGFNSTRDYFLFGAGMVRSCIEIKEVKV